MNAIRHGARYVLFICFLTISQSGHAEELIVAAAASLNNAFSELGADFERAYPGSNLVFSFAASDVLVQQILRGAPVDVLASADQIAMDKAVTQGLIVSESRIDFARNVLVVAAPAKQSLMLKSLNDLLNPAVKKLAVSKPDSVPAGRYAKQALVDAGVWEALQPKFVFTQNVRQSLDYIGKGEVEAGIVYVTDAAALPSKVTVVFEVPLKTAIHYPIALVTDTKVSDLAKKFIAYVVSEPGQSILRKHGFKRP